MTRGRDVAAWTLLALLGLALGCGMVELGVRMLHLVPDRFWQRDRQLGTCHVAGKTGWWTQEEREFRTYVRINRQGLRDVDHDYAKPRGATRVLLLGDSFVEALQVDEEQMLARRMEAMLGGHTEVISAGVSGYGTASQLLFLQHEGVRYQPDVVVLAFYPGNDVKNNSPTLEDELPPLYDEEGRLVRVTGGADGAAQPRSWQRRLRSYQFVRQLILRNPVLVASMNRLGLMRAKGPRTAPQRDGVPVDYWVFSPQPDAEWRTAWRHTEQLLEQMQALASAHGARFAIAIVPSRYQIYPEWWRETLAAHPSMRGRQWDLEGPARRVSAWCEAHGIACLDLSTGLRAAAPGATPLYYHHDGHWTAAGHDAVARLLVDFLREQRVMADSTSNGH